MEEQSREFRIPDIFIARDGTWYSDGLEVIHQKIFKLFNECLHRDPDGGYYIEVRGQRCPVRVENTPFVARSLFYENDEQGCDVLWLILNSGERQALRPETLIRCSDGELRCRLDNGLDAALSRQAATQLGPFLDCDPQGAFFIVLNGRQYPL